MVGLYIQLYFMNKTVLFIKYILWTEGKIVIGTIETKLTNLVVKALLTLLHSERPKLYTILAFLSAIGLSHRAHKIKCANIFA